MTRDQAKDILAAYRPGRDDDEPLVVKALALARQDAELQSWYEAQRQLDAVIREKLRQADVSVDLSAQIHAAVAARQSSHWRKLLPLAACLVLLGVLAGVWWSREHAPAVSFARYQSDMAVFLKTFPALEVQTEKLPEMRQWLASKHRLTQIELPVGLEKFPGIGCRTVQWRDKELALLCFMVDGEVVHLFVMRAEEFPTAALADTPQIGRSGIFTTAAWRKNGTAYLALTPGDAAFLRTHL